MSRRPTYPTDHERTNRLTIVDTCLAQSGIIAPAPICQDSLPKSIRRDIWTEEDLRIMAEVNAGIAEENRAKKRRYVENQKNKGSAFHL